MLLIVYDRGQRYKIFTKRQHFYATFLSDGLLISIHLFLGFVLFVTVYACYSLSTLAVSEFLSIFAGKIKHLSIMTAVQLNNMNIELWQSIGAIADDKPLMRRLTRYAKKLVKEKQEDSTLLSEEEFFARIEAARKQSGKRFDNVEQLDQYIQNL